jgi:hypothetical protein
MADCPWRWRRTISAALPLATAKHYALHGTGLFLFQSVPFGTKFVDLVEHSFQEGFGRGRGNPCPLELSDFAPLPLDLDPHPLNFGPDEFKLHVLALSQFAGGQRGSAGPPVREAATGSTI